MGNNKLKKEIGLFVATALVIGNMMGAGIFMLPKQLAQVGGVGSSIIAWLITGTGAMLLALTFANLGSKIPKSGGIVDYSKDAFGDFMGFITGWLYWNGSWIGNTTLFVVILSYFGQVFTSLTNSPVIGFIFCSILLWSFTYINIRGTKTASKLGTVLTVFKICLFIFFICIAAMNFNMNNLTPAFPEGSGVETIPMTAAITLWAFMGLETASIASGEIKNPEKNVKRSTILGIAISTGLYILISILAMGAMSQSELAQTSAPISDIIAKFLGSGVVKYLNVAIAISICGTALGWLLSTARVAYAAGEQGIFPKAFAKLHPKYETPYIALIAGSILVNIVFFMNFIQGLSNAYNFIVLLATIAYLPIYAVSAIAEIVLLKNNFKKLSFINVIKGSFRSIIGFLFALWAISSAGGEAVMYGFLLIMLGIPVYAYMKIKREHHSKNSAEKDFIDESKAS